MSNTHNENEKVMIDIIFLLNKLKQSQKEILALIGSQGGYPANPSTK